LSIEGKRRRGSREEVVKECRIVGMCGETQAPMKRKGEEGEKEESR